MSAKSNSKSNKNEFDAKREFRELAMRARLIEELQKTCHHSFVMDGYSSITERIIENVLIKDLLIPRCYVCVHCGMRVENKP